MQSQRSLKIIGSLLLLGLLGLFILRNTAFSGWDFRNNLWGPAYLLIHGQSPYRVDALFDLGNAVWMPMPIGIFFPLGLLPFQQANNLWFVFNISCILLIVWISSDSRRPSVIWLAVAILVALLFPSTVTHLWLGQITILIMLVFIIAARWHDTLSPLLLAALIAIGMSKPQLGILVFPGIFVHQMRQRGTSKAVQLGVLVVICILLMTLPLFIAYPNWISGFLFEMQLNPSWAHPSSLHFLMNTLPDAGLWIWAMLFTIVFIVNIWLWVKLPARQAVQWSLALTILVTPYVWTWDFVMLLPLFISALFQAKTKLSLAVLLGGYTICWSMIASFKVRDDVNDSLLWWAPWLFMLVLVCNQILVRGNYENPG